VAAASRLAALPAEGRRNLCLVRKARKPGRWPLTKISQKVWDNFRSSSFQLLLETDSQKPESKTDRRKIFEVKKYESRKAT
jgi:hypothetical protein